MSRISQRFADLREQQRKALIPYITAGDPSPDVTPELLHTLVSAGADLVEIGVPFSDPQSDGPVIQNACQRALEQGVTLRDVLAIVRRFRQQDNGTPVILMGYSNPIEAIGVENFAAEAAAAGVDGVIVVDAPPEEGGDLITALVDHGIDPIFLIAPTTAAERIERIASTARGFIYYVSLRGVTGAQAQAHAEVENKIAEIRHHTALPVGVGFGIRDAESAQRLGRRADAIVVGSAVVQRIADHGADSSRLHEELRGFVSSLREALDTALEENAT